MAHHQHGEALLGAEAFEQAVQLALAGHIDPLGRLIQHQQLRAVQQGARQQHATLLATRERGERAVEYLGHIELIGERQATEVVLRVRDSGIGIAPDMLRHVFDLFAQAERPLDRTEGGLGIGLTIVKHLVEMHGGDVEAGSEGVGKGSEFRVRLPRTKRPISLASAPRQSDRRGRRRRVLVVEDNRDCADSLHDVLALEGHDVRVVHDGAAALAMLDQFSADIVLLDVGLPRMDGYMVAHAQGET